jgi:endoglucanase
VPRLARALLAIALILQTTPGQAAGATIPAVPAAGLSALRVDGNRLVDSSGRPVILRGVNRMGTEYMCAQDRGIVDGPVDQAAISSIKAWRVNVVRIPLNEHCWLGIDDGAVTPQYVGEAYRQRVHELVNDLIANGLYVILDLHWSAHAGEGAIGQRPMPNTSHSVDFWASVATRFGGDSRVIFDVFNEPVPNNNANDDDDVAARRAWECWRDGGATSCDATLDLGTDTTRMSSSQTIGMQALVDAVRGTGATNVIMVGGIGWANTVWSSAARNWLTYRPTDPLGNLAVSVHLYRDAWCVTEACYDSEIAAVAAQVPVIAGEFGITSCDAADEAWLTTLLLWLNSNEIGYLAWAWITLDPGQGACSSAKLLTDYDGTPTPFGQIYKTHLASLPVETATALSSSAARSFEGQAVTFTAQVTAVGGSGAPTGNVLFALDGIDAQTVTLDATGRAAFATTFVDNGGHNVSARYLGASPFQASTSPTVTQTVDNAAPAAGALVGPLEPFSVGTATEVRATFTDPGVADAHTATIDWGDGTTSGATIVEASGAGSLSASHTYSAAGIYRVVVTILDDDGGSTSSALDSLVVFDRSAGFLGGAGWVDSPPGAYAASPTTTGRAMFAFVAWYRHEPSPSGKAHVALRAATFTFESTSYDWLVIVGSQAQLRGSGRVNGAASYEFLVSALDGRESGGADRLRIKVWNSVTGAVIYDSQMAAPDGADPTTAVAAGGVAIRDRPGGD